MKILYKSKKRSIDKNISFEDNQGWETLHEDASYWKTDIQRSGWRVPGAINLDDEEDDD